MVNRNWAKEFKTCDFCRTNYFCRTNSKRPDESGRGGREWPRHRLSDGRRKFCLCKGCMGLGAVEGAA